MVRVGEMLAYVVQRPCRAPWGPSQQRQGHELAGELGVTSPGPLAPEPSAGPAYGGGCGTVGRGSVSPGRVSTLQMRAGGGSRGGGLQRPLETQLGR